MNDIETVATRQPRPKIFCLGPHQPVNCKTLRDLLNQNILVISVYDTQGLVPDTLDDFLESVRKIVDSNPIIELILYDMTADPAGLDNPDHLITARMIRHYLSRYRPAIIVSEDYNYYYKSSDHVVYFPWHMWLCNTKSIGRLYNFHHSVYDTVLEKTQAVVCVNRNLHWHRLYLFSLLATRSWFGKINYSFIQSLGNRLENPYSVQRYLDSDERQAIAALGHRLPMHLKEEQHLTLPEIPYVFCGGGVSVDDVAHTNYAINIVTETSLTEGVIITEKTCKAIMAYQIPIIVGPVGACQFLKDIGIDMFGDHVPWHTWDHVADHKRRIRMIVDFLETLLAKDTAEQDIISLHTSLHSRLVQNKQYFHSAEFTNTLQRSLRNQQL